MKVKDRLIERWRNRKVWSEGKSQRMALLLLLVLAPAGLSHFLGFKMLGAACMLLGTVGWFLFGVYTKDEWIIPEV